MIETVFGDRSSISAPAPAKISSRERKMCAMFNPFTAPAAEWTETNMYHYLAQPTVRRVPVLQDIEEIRVRKVGNPKLKCVFSNDAHEDCVVWVASILMHQHYPVATRHAENTLLRSICERVCASK